MQHLIELLSVFFPSPVSVSQAKEETSAMQGTVQAPGILDKGRGVGGGGGNLGQSYRG